MDISRETINIELIQKYIIEYFRSMNTDDAIINNNLAHAYRYLITLNYIVNHNLLCDGRGIVFETGDSGVFTFLLNKILKFHNIIHHGGDLRDSIELSENCVDTILCMEVIEHIADDKRYHEMHFEGVRTMFKSFGHILKPNGRILLTTPNITSYMSMMRLLKNKNPMTYPIHVKEYSPEEINLLATKCGFGVDLLSTEFAFISPSRYKLLHLLLKLFNFNVQNRGDTIFAILRKNEQYKFEECDLAALFLQYMF